MGCCPGNILLYTPMGRAVDHARRVPEDDLTPEDGDIRPGTVLQRANDPAASAACRAATPCLIGFNANTVHLEIWVRLNNSWVKMTGFHPISKAAESQGGYLNKKMD